MCVLSVLRYDVSGTQVIPSLYGHLVKQLNLLNLLFMVEKNLLYKHLFRGIQ